MTNEPARAKEEISMPKIPNIAGSKKQKADHDDAGDQCGGLSIDF